MQNLPEFMILPLYTRMVYTGILQDVNNDRYNYDTHNQLGNASELAVGYMGRRLMELEDQCEYIHRLPTK